MSLNKRFTGQISLNDDVGALGKRDDGTVRLNDYKRENVLLTPTAWRTKLAASYYRAVTPAIPALPTYGFFRDVAPGNPATQPVTYGSNNMSMEALRDNRVKVAAGAEWVGSIGIQEISGSSFNSSKQFQNFVGVPLPKDIDKISFILIGGGGGGGGEDGGDTGGPGGRGNILAARLRTSIYGATNVDRHLWLVAGGGGETGAQRPGTTGAGAGGGGQAVWRALVGDASWSSYFSSNAVAISPRSPRLDNDNVPGTMSFPATVADGNTGTPWQVVDFTVFVPAGTYTLEYAADNSLKVFLMSELDGSLTQLATTGANTASYNLAAPLTATVTLPTKTTGPSGRFPYRLRAHYRNFGAQGGFVMVLKNAGGTVVWSARENQSTSNRISGIFNMGKGGRGGVDGSNGESGAGGGGGAGSFIVMDHETAGPMLIAFAGGGGGGGGQGNSGANYRVYANRLNRAYTTFSDPDDARGRGTYISVQNMQGGEGHSVQTNTNLIQTAINVSMYGATTTAFYEFSYWKPIAFSASEATAWSDILAANDGGGGGGGGGFGGIPSFETNVIDVYDGFDSPTYFYSFQYDDAVGGGSAGASGVYVPTGSPSDAVSAIIDNAASFSQISLISSAVLPQASDTNAARATTRYAPTGYYQRTTLPLPVAFQQGAFADDERRAGSNGVGSNTGNNPVDPLSKGHGAPGFAYVEWASTADLDESGDVNGIGP